MLEALRQFFAQRWRQLLVAFLGVALPLMLFAELADEVHEAESFGFDEPLLRFAEQNASPALDRAMLLASELGYGWGVVPADLLLGLGLLAFSQVRRAVFFVLAAGGSALLNLLAKAVFQRERPDLWLSIAPEHTFSFPSGHAMGSATLATAVVVLCWHTAWRWPVLLMGVAFTLWVGASRIYLGVHFPSDILAGWAAAVTWVCAVTLIVRPNPPQSAPPGPVPAP